MNKTSVFLWSLAICAVFSACNGQNAQPLAMGSNTPRSTETSTATPYPIKQVLLDYTVGGYHTPYEIYYTDYGANGWSTLVLYMDGQLILSGKTYQQKILSEEEIDQVFTQLESKGFFSLTQENLYNFGNQEPPRVYDGTTYCVLTMAERKQKLCAYEPHQSFLVPEMINVLQFINKYHPEGLTPYQPDRILLWVRTGRSPHVENLPEKAISWPERFSSLETPDEKIMYFQSNEAREIYALFGNEISTIVVNQNEKEYTVSIDIILPHEQLSVP